MQIDRLQKGVSGILRVKNDANFIKRCVYSCIDVLDELVIVFNDCCDNSAEIIEEMRRLYPDKIHVYEYPYKVYSNNLTLEEYEMIKKQPDDSPHLLSSYYNYALSKVKYQYALKIDADQIYMTKELGKWCEFCRKVTPLKMSKRAFLGSLFQAYLSFYRYISLGLKYVFPMMPYSLVRLCYPAYLEYAKYLFSHDKACLSMSGINVLEDGKKTYVSLGLKSDEVNILPPFNGEGDHLIFKVMKNTFYRKFDMKYYNTQRNMSYSLIEEFVHPYRAMYIGYYWIHINAMRSGVVEKVLELKKKYPKSFVEIADFVGLDYKSILCKADKNLFSLFQRILFSFVYKANQTILQDKFGKQ